MIRDLQSNLVGKVIVVPGIITSTSKTAVRARTAVYKCSNCGHEKHMELPLGLTKVVAPSICDNARNAGPDKQNCGLGSYHMDTDKCEFIDQQILKL